MPALVLDPATLARLRRNPRRAAYFCAAVGSLATDVGRRGARLVCRRGPLLASTLRLVRQSRASRVAWTIAYDAATLAAQRKLQTALEEAGIAVLAVHDAPAVPPEETAAARSADEGRGYSSRAAYLAAWAQQPHAPFTATLHFAPLMPESDRLPQTADFASDIASPNVGERQARRECAAYLAAPALQYATARDVPAGPPTARLSAALSFGTIAARTVLHAIDERARDRFLLVEERRSLDALRRSLGERDFFLQLAWFFEGSPDAPLQARMRRFPFAREHPALAAWRDGRTGYPLVDAGMRQLRATGWMHPRARAVAASFLCFDLAVDWRIGRDAWERELEEDDAAVATGNWQWIAGVGADLAQFPRIYNPRKQARTYDPAGTYARRWIPELRGLPVPGLAGAPRRSDPQLGLPLFDAEPYPEPVVNHERAARDFLRRYGEFRSSAANASR